MGVVGGERRAAKRVLVVDDEPTIRELVAAALDEAGYRAVTAANGADAWRCMRRNAPDAIVLDLMMPVMNAARLIELMRQNARLAHVPVLIVSAAYDACEEARSLGASACLTKPFQLEDVIDNIASLVGVPELGPTLVGAH
jgi:two-component system OmpR family response regulator